MCTADSALSNESHENLSTVPFAGTKEQEVIQPLATGLTLPTLLAVLMRAGLTHRSDPASSKLMDDLFLSMVWLLTSNSLDLVTIDRWLMRGNKVFYVLSAKFQFKLQQWPGYSHHAGVQQGSPTQHRYPYYDSRYY